MVCVSHDDGVAETCGSTTAPATLEDGRRASDNFKHSANSTVHGTGTRCDAQLSLHRSTSNGTVLTLGTLLAFVRLLSPLSKGA